MLATALLIIVVVQVLILLAIVFMWIEQREASTHNELIDRVIEVRLRALEERYDVPAYPSYFYPTPYAGGLTSSGASPPR